MTRARTVAADIASPRAPVPDGVLLVDKPDGPTSHDVVAAVRRLLHVRRVGHCGTLDPFATGLLVCCVGRATRLARFISGADKTYSGTIRFGTATDSGDRTGRPLGAPLAVPAIDSAALQEAAQRLTGVIAQVPPMHSAKKRGGRPLHSLARQGIEVPREPVDVVVRGWNLGSLAGDCLPFVVTCGAGTYVRALAEQLGRLVDCPAHLQELRREASGAFRIEEAVATDRLSPAEALARIIPLDSVPLPLPSLEVDEALAEDFRHGRQLPSATTHPLGSEVAVVGPGGALLGIARAEAGGLLAPTVVLAAAD